MTLYDSEVLYDPVLGAGGVTLELSDDVHRSRSASSRLCIPVVALPRHSQS